MLLLFGACCKWGHHLYTIAAPSCCIPPSYCHLSATVQTMSIAVANLQDNWMVFWIFITLLMFSFDSPSYIWICSVVCLIWFNLQHYFCTCSKWSVKAIKSVNHRHCIWYFQLKYTSCCCFVLKQVLTPTVKLGMDQYLVCFFLIVGILMWYLMWINPKCVFLLE